MRLWVVNGSPRGKRGNTQLLLDAFLEGFKASAENKAEVTWLNGKVEPEDIRERFTRADAVLLAFPLYVDAMPARVKEFIEALAPRCGQPENPPMAFLVQSGFPEAHHSRFVARYLEKLTQRLGSVCLGVMIKGGIEGIQERPAKTRRKMLAPFEKLGRCLGETGQLDEAMLQRLARPERFTGLTLLGAWFVLRFTRVGRFLEKELKKNGVYEQRAARPYKP